MKRIAQKELAMGPWQYDDSVEVIYMNSFEEYDCFVKENIVIVDLWAATANNAVLEAIALNAPFFIRKLPIVRHSILGSIIRCFSLLSKSFRI